MNAFRTTAARGVVSPLVALASLALTSAVQAQVTFNVDFYGPSMSLPDSHWAFPITEADFLSPLASGPLPTLGPLPPPGIEYSGGAFPVPGLGLAAHPGCVGHPPGFPCGVEVDAMSYGRDWNLDPLVPLMPGGNLWFSVDLMAAGDPATGFTPDVFSEAGTGEAAADVFVDIGLVHGTLAPFPGGLPPGAIPPANVQAIDGDGLLGPTGSVCPGLGLLEGPFGDNLDGLDVHTSFFLPSLFFSLDSAFLDPIRGVPNSGSAAVHGFAGGDVLWVPMPNAPILVFAPAVLLGLDLAGADTDDLDALILWESGDGVFTPSLVPYDWNAGLGFDMLLFSVRRGSAVIGAFDSLLGLPIEEGDILTTPFVAGGPPAIFIAAENLGLVTARSGVVQFGDDLVGADSSHAPVLDCDFDGIEDAVAIALGIAGDANNDGVPDPCQLEVAPYCFGFNCPCGNDNVFGGCINLTGQGALMLASGSSVHVADDLVLATTGMPLNNFGYYFMGGARFPIFPTQNGMVCVGAGALGLFRFPVQNTGASGSFSMGPGIVALTQALFPPGIQPGFTWNFQVWYRDPGGPCGFNSNYSNAISVRFVP